MRTKNRDSFLGIYKITNPEGLIYIGKSSDIRKRWLAYKYTMAKGQPKLNASFVEFGIGANLK